MFKEDNILFIDAYFLNTTENTTFENLENFNISVCDTNNKEVLNKTFKSVVIPKGLPPQHGRRILFPIENEFLTYKKKIYQNYLTNSPLIIIKILNLSLNQTKRVISKVNNSMYENNFYKTYKQYKENTLGKSSNSLNVFVSFIIICCYITFLFLLIQLIYILLNKFHFPCEIAFFFIFFIYEVSLQRYFPFYFLNF